MSRKSGINVEQGMDNGQYLTLAVRVMYKKIWSSPFFK